MFNKIPYETLLHKLSLSGWYIIHGSYLPSSIMQDKSLTIHTHKKQWNWDNNNDEGLWKLPQFLHVRNGVLICQTHGTARQEMGQKWSILVRPGFIWRGRRLLKKLKSSTCWNNPKSYPWRKPRQAMSPLNHTINTQGYLSALKLKITHPIWQHCQEERSEKSGFRPMTLFFHINVQLSRKLCLMSFLMYFSPKFPSNKDSEPFFNAAAFK